LISSSHLHRHRHLYCWTLEMMIQEEVSLA
jgi:hypothetical protein